MAKAWRLAVLIEMATLAIAFEGFPNAGSAQVQCQIQIDSPGNNNEVGQTQLISGKAKKPAGTFLWLLAHKKGFATWWPQGGGPASLDPRTDTWNVSVFFGVPRDVNSEFEVMVMVTDKTGNEALMKWVENADKAQVYVPVAPPPAVAGCDTRILTVRKTE